MDDTENVQQQQTTVPVAPESNTALEEIEFAPLVDYFTMERPTLDEKNDLRYLYQWARKQGAIEKGDILRNIKRLEIKLGHPPTSENRIKRIINYLKIDDQIDSLLLEQSAYTK